MNEHKIRKYDEERGPYESLVPEDLFQKLDYRPVEMETENHGTVTIDWPWGGESGANFLDEMIAGAEAAAEAEL